MNELTKDEVDAIAKRTIPHNAASDGPEPGNAEAGDWLHFHTVLDERGYESGPNIAVGPFGEHGAMMYDYLVVTDADNPDANDSVSALEYATDDDFAEAVARRMVVVFDPTGSYDPSTALKAPFPATFAERPTDAPARATTAFAAEANLRLARPGWMQPGDAMVMVTADEAEAIAEIARQVPDNPHYASLAEKLARAGGNT